MDIMVIGNGLSILFYFPKTKVTRGILINCLILPKYMMPYKAILLTYL